MTAWLEALPVPWRVPRLAGLVAGVAAFAGLLVLRALGLHAGLLYPDAYQYLLMARGIGEHLEPMTTLGQGGDVFGPNPDAAAKPLFPTIVALLSALGASPLGAARAVTVVAGAAVPALTGLVALRLGAGRSASLIAVLLCAASPTLAYWAGYAGPDPLAPALALAAGLALLHWHPVVGGVLAGLCVLARPSYLLVALAAVTAGLLVQRTRREAAQALGAATLTAGGLLAVVRPPLSAPEAKTIVGAVVVVALAAVLLLIAGRVGLVGAGLITAAAIGPLIVLDGGAWESVGRRDWALVTLAATGLVLALRARAPRTVALSILALSLPLAIAYWVKNPGLERYTAQLVPELSLVAAVGLGTLRRYRLAVTTSAIALIGAGAIIAPRPSVGIDSFQELSPALDRAPAGPLVTAAPDAYGFLLPDRPIRAMRAGAEGLVLVDGAARAYAPELRAEGTLVRRIPVITGFLRPDGAIDRSPALLYRGRVVEGGR